MKKTKISLFITVLFIFLFQSLSFSQSSFEGKIDMKMTFDGRTHNMSYLVKNDKIRMEFNRGGHTGAVIIDPANKSTIVLMPQQKMYMEMPVTKEMEEGISKKNKDVKFSKTGETKTINGYKCEKWVYSSDDEQGEAWMTKDLGSFTLFSGGPMRRQNNQPDWMKELENEGAFPMLVTIKDKSGNDKGQLEVTSVKKESLNSDLFTPPSDYKKFDMPQMHMQGGN